MAFFLPKGVDKEGHWPYLLVIKQVFAIIAQAGQCPHWAYAAGMSRLSCCFCIMASRADLTTAARLAPDLYRRYVEIEKRLGFTLSPSRVYLEDLTGIASENQTVIPAIPAFLDRRRDIDLIALATA